MGSDVARILVAVAISFGIYLHPVVGQSLQQITKSAKAKGLKGYKLIDACDVWFGQSDPPYGAPRMLIDALGDGNGRATLKDWLDAGLPKEHFEYFDTDHSGEFDAAEANKWFLQQRRTGRSMNLSEVENPPKGHLQRLGSWKDPLPAEGLTYTKPYPHPREFWKKHMDEYLPALLKGAQHGWPCMNWTREVLTERFGDFDAKLEPKVEGRGNDTAYADLDSISPNHRLSIKDYLRLERDKNMYVVSILPQSMAWEVAHPSALLCGSRKSMLNKRTQPPHHKEMPHQYPNELGHAWMTHIFEVNLWIASGRTRSQFHYDKEWNVNCLLSGRKRWFFMNPFLYDDDLNWVRGRKFKKKAPLNNAWTDWVYLDPDRVDLIVNHKMRNMDYYELIQEAGDCIFIPYAMLHQVEKLGDDLQVAASWMFLPETIYREEDCQDVPLDEDLPLGAMDNLYAYSGKGIIPQGYPDPLDFVNKLRGEMDQDGEKVLTLKTLKKVVSRGDAVLAKVKDRKARIKSLFKKLTSYAKDPTKGLMRDELLSVPLRVWCKPAAEGDEEGPLPCDAGQEYHVLDDEEFGKAKEFLEKLPKSSGRAPPGVKLPRNTRVYSDKQKRDEL